MSRATDIPGLRWRDFEWRTLALVFAVTLLILLSVVLLPQYVSREARMSVLRNHVGEVARLAASVVDGDVQRQLLDRSNYSQALYDQAVLPLVKLHSADPDIYYAYTMAEVNGEVFFILDTAQSPLLKTARKLEPSGYFERFVLRTDYDANWTKALAAGDTWVTPTFEHDDYGYFLSGHAPIYDHQGHYVGFVGVDYDTDYFHAQEAKFNQIAWWSVLAVLVLSVLISYGLARYHFQWQYRLALHYHSSMRDEQTQLLNRRGAYEAVEVLRRRRSRAHAVILIDIDNFKTINDGLGHMVGDAVLVSLAGIIRRSVRDQDVVARLGGDEFLVFAPDCDEDAAIQIATRLQQQVAEQQDVATPYTLSVGICFATSRYGAGVQEFDDMYRRADEAMYRAKAAGKNRFEVVAA